MAQRPVNLCAINFRALPCHAKQRPAPHSFAMGLYFSRVKAETVKCNMVA